MSNKDQVGKIQTVTGTIDPSELGKTSTHEHIYLLAMNFLMLKLYDLDQPHPQIF